MSEVESLTAHNPIFECYGTLGQIPQVTHNTFPLSLAHMVKTGTQRAENTHISSPVHYAYTMNHWFNMAVRQLPQLCRGTASNQQGRECVTVDFWYRLYVPFTAALAAFSLFGRQLHLNSPQLCVFGLLNWLQKPWQSEFNLQAEQVECTAVPGQETRKSRKCLMNYHEHNKPEERKKSQMRTQF